VTRRACLVWRAGAVLVAAPESWVDLGAGFSVYPRCPEAPVWIAPLNHRHAPSTASSGELSDQTRLGRARIVLRIVL